MALAEDMRDIQGEVQQVQRRVASALDKQADRGARSPPQARSPVASPSATSPATSPPLSPRAPSNNAARAPVTPSAPARQESTKGAPLQVTSQELERAQHILGRLSPPVYLQLQFLVRFFARVCTAGTVSVKKLCRVFGPVVVHGNTQDSTALVQEAFAAPTVLRLLIENYTHLFAPPNTT